MRRRSAAVLALYFARTVFLWILLDGTQIYMQCAIFHTREYGAQFCISRLWNPTADGSRLAFLHGVRYPVGGVSLGLRRRPPPHGSL
jgi:hypothetical protein